MFKIFTTSIAVIVLSLIATMSLSAGGWAETDDTDVSPPASKDSVSAYYPITITNYNRSKEQVEQNFDSTPERVVAVYQNSIETLLALGVEDVIVGAAGLDHEIKPELEAALNSINYYEDGLNKEQIMAMNPDFIVSWYSFFGDTKLGDVDFWHERNVNTFIMSNSGVRSDRMLAHEFSDIYTLGRIFNREERAEKIVSDIKAEMAKGVAFAEGRTPVKAVVLQLRKDGTFRIYGKDSVGGDMASQIGADLVAKESGNIGAEDLVKLNPEVIFTVYYSYFGGSVELEDAMNTITGHDGLQSISAVQTGRVHPIKLGEVYCSGIRTMDGVKTMLSALYPNEYK